MSIATAPSLLGQPGPEPWRLDETGPAETGTPGVGVAFVPRSYYQFIDGLLSTSKWGSLSIDYSFPDSTADYNVGYPSGPLTGFSGLNALQVAATHDMLNAANWNNPGAFSNATRNAMRAAAGTLGSYNEGDIGPGHCGDLVPPTVALTGPTTASSVVASPNPFSASTAVTFTLEQNEQVSVVVYDLLGREVAALAAGPVGAGQHEAVLDGRALPAGVYLVRMTAGGFSQARRVTLVR